MKKCILYSMVAGIVLMTGIAQADIIFQDDFSTDMGWTLTQTWERGPAAVSPAATGTGDPEFDNTPTADNYVLGAAIGGNIGAPDGLHDFWYAFSPVIDLGMYENVEFSYYRWLNSDYKPFMQSTVDVFDGAAWNQVWEFGSAGSPGLFDDSWTLQNFDVSAYADGNSVFQIRYGYDVTSSGVWTTGGWNVDDVLLTGNLTDDPGTQPIPEPATLLLLGTGIASLTSIRLRKKKR